MIELELPWPTSVNHYKNVGRTITTKTGKSYQQRYNSKETMGYYYDVWVIVKSLPPEKRKLMPLESTIAIDVTLHPPDYRKRDIDGPIKVLLDSLVRGGVIKDDYLITRLLIERMHIIKNGKVFVKIRDTYE